MINSLGAMLNSALSLLFELLSFHFPEMSVVWAETLTEIDTIIKKSSIFFIGLVLDVNRIEI